MVATYSVVAAYSVAAAYSVVAAYNVVAAYSVVAAYIVVAASSVVATYSVVAACSVVGRAAADWLKGLVRMLLADCYVLQSQMKAAATLRILEPITAIKSSTAFGLLCTSKRCIDWAAVQKQATVDDLVAIVLEWAAIVLEWAAKRPNCTKLLGSSRGTIKLLELIAQLQKQQRKSLA